LEWNNSTDCYFWSSVICDTEGYVIGLYLNEEHISGGLNNSSSLFSLQHLQELDLSNNNFNSTIPSGFSKLKKLTELDLSTSHFYGTLSNSISNLTNLTYLDLSQNDLCGAIPNSMSNLTHHTNNPLVGGAKQTKQPNNNGPSNNNQPIKINGESDN
jgi:hypothetical protein